MSDAPGRPVITPLPPLEVDAGFVLATGIECSAPLVGGHRVDELEKTGHYARWEEDLALVRQTGIRYLRYGLPIHRLNPAPGVFDWSFPDAVLARMRELGIVPILDLLHFGVPDDLRDIGHPGVPARLEAFAGAVAQRYPWVRHYTPVNEPYITALFSARLGWWNEQRTDDRSFVRALLGVCRAHVLAARAIRAIRPDAVLITSESCQEHHPLHPDAAPAAALENELRFTSLELIYGRPLPGIVAGFLLSNGATRDDLAWFERHGSDAGAIVGNDYYEGSEQLVERDGSTRPAGVRSGYARLARTYHERLRLPIMHSETNSDGPDPVEWLMRQWSDVALLRREGVPIRGFTWYGFVNHVDWDSGLRVDRGRENPCGLVTLARTPNPVHAAFRRLADQLATEQEAPALTQRVTPRVPPPAVSLLAGQPHRRYDPLRDAWVLVSPGRTERPWQGSVEDAPAESRPRYDPTCYLCPGNTRASGDANPDYSGTFVFTNDFAALRPDSTEAVVAHGLLRAQGVPGTCRVLCFSPRHDLTLGGMSVAEIRQVVDAWADQTAELGARYRWVQVFENRGAMMGASNPHPHGQIWAGAALPVEAAREDATQRRYRLETGRRLLADVVEAELDGPRVIVRTRDWLVIVPFWAVWPFETLVLPLGAASRITDLDGARRDDLALAVREILRCYDGLFAQAFPYSMGWHQAPFGADAEHWQLHAHFYPPLLRSATVRKFMVGYELLSEPQRDITPEEAAERLRGVAGG